MSAAEINIDDFVNYEEEYKGVIKEAKIQGDQLVGRCPFHDDKEASFTANLKTGQCHCFCGCIDGNFTTFYAKLHGIDTKEAYKEILDRYGKLEKPEEKPKSKKNKSYTLKQYAMEKRLPEDFLKGECRASTGRDKDGTQFLKLPYYNEDGSAPIFRKRYANKEFRWSYGSAGKLILYGEWRLEEIRKAGYAVLVEGESDTQSLWYLKVPALGVPGAQNFNARMVPALQDLKIYLHIEPDQAGEAFLEKVCRILHENDFIGEVYTFSCKQFGVKDPSELYLTEGETEASNKIWEALRSAERVDFEKLADVIPVAIQDAPANLRQPEGWRYDEGGIRMIEEKKALLTLVCRTPIILTKRLKSMESGEEKIEVAFKRDGKWSTAIFPRSTIFTSRSITALADLGCTVTSENAKNVVRFLEALEAENIDVIEKAESTSTFGWQTNGRFLPGHGDDIVLDIDPSLRGWAAAYHTAGTFEDWIELMRPHRERDKFRFILAASFAAPLLKILQQRIFFVYNWGGSKGGKTAALKAALSAWGDPERLMVNFNATQVALERMAGFFNDLPLGIDERQLAGNKQESLEKIVYMISSGTGRARGSKGGGLQQLNTWRTVAIATGEEPLSTETSQTGVSTRVLELYGAPFDDEKSASLMHQLTPGCCGWAGPYFIERILEMDERTITDLYTQLSEKIYTFAGSTSGSHIAGIAAVTLADAMIDAWIFGPDGAAKTQQGKTKKPLELPEASINRAIDMARAIVAEDQNSGLKDVNENATQYIVDWILSNRSQFGDKAIGQCLGFFSDDKSKAYIYPSLFNQALSRAGYSARKTLKYLGDQEIVTATNKSDGTGKEYCVRKWFNGATSRFVEFNLKPFTKKEDGEDPEEDGDGFMSAEGSPFDDDGDGYEQAALPF